MPIPTGVLSSRTSSPLTGPQPDCLGRAPPRVLEGIRAAPVFESGLDNPVERFAGSLTNLDVRGTRLTA